MGWKMSQDGRVSQLKASTTPSKIAKEIGVQYSTVLAWIHARQLPALDISSGSGQKPRYRISRHDLDAFLASRRTVPQVDQKSTRTNTALDATA